MNKLTFIVPTLGRPTLKKTILSLINQTDPNWKAIVVFDGVKNVDKKLKIKDERLIYLQIEKTLAQTGGLTRNEGIKHTNTEWVAFVDDDDVIHPSYIEKFNKELSLKPDLECIIFRMVRPALLQAAPTSFVCYDCGMCYLTDEDLETHQRKYSHYSNVDSIDKPITYNDVFPRPEEKNFHLKRVGISFAYKKSLFDIGCKFIPGEYEDFDFLNQIRNKKAKMVISPYTMYFVKTDYCDMIPYKRAYINFTPTKVHTYK